ncbi:hypothetical protein M6D81_17880 [Paenibacillus sp. J5C_2022]|uniref:hypothetical protein n=1 Tax=Paenibacillus sp. J5C2022 TaxID=2977129 RepID=UPI0021CEF98F|nr:hypothetical protein [Paenibacillus sp. J5C2022]MCU6710566.1 hypothetical protein [Paenibacillus sp. J5C2022]
MVKKRPIGYGTLAILLLMMGFLFNWNFSKGFVFSHYLFQLFDLKIYSIENRFGFHLPFMAAIIFWIPAVLVSKKYPNHYGADLSHRLGSFMLAISVIVFVFYLIDLIIY